MSREHEQFISEDDEELKHIRQKKLKELAESKEKKPAMNTEPVHLTDSNFNETVNAHPLVLVDFWASWCGPCMALGPIIEQLAKEFTGKVFVAKLDVDENPSTAEHFQVFSIPTVIIIKNGKEVDRIVGLVPKKHLEASLGKHMG